MRDCYVACRRQHHHDRLRQRYSDFIGYWHQLWCNVQRIFRQRHGNYARRNAIQRGVNVHRLARKWLYGHIDMHEDNERGS